MTALTAGHLLGGRIRYAQPTAGYRTGIEPVLLAASVPAIAGQRVLEAGTGAGAGLLCCCARIAGLHAVGVELDPALAALARCNLADNRVTAQIVTGDIATVPLAPFDHAFANPPWHDWRSTASPDAARRRAKQAGPQTLRIWVDRLASLLRDGGTLTLILPAGQGAAASANLAAAGLGRVALLSLLPKQGRPAKLALVQARRGPASVTPSACILHEADGAYTPAMQRILRDGAPLLEAASRRSESPET